MGSRCRKSPQPHREDGSCPRAVAPARRGHRHRRLHRHDAFGVTLRPCFPSLTGTPRSPGSTHPSRTQGIIAAFETTESDTLDDIVAFHVPFEHTHPFQDGNDRVGSLVMFKEYQRNAVTSLIVAGDMSLFHHRGLVCWDDGKGPPADTWLLAQDTSRQRQGYFRISSSD